MKRKGRAEEERNQIADPLLVSDSGVCRAIRFKRSNIEVWPVAWARHRLKNVSIYTDVLLQRFIPSLLCNLVHHLRVTFVLLAVAK
jgi:hypothetical protein